VTSAENTIQNQLEGPRSSDQDRDHCAAAALSSLARASTPTDGQFHEPASANTAHRSSDAPPSPLGANENETYEWDEGGDEKELGIDAMGAASTRDYKPGFFGWLLLKYI
jgi:hypothetical protein